MEDICVLINSVLLWQEVPLVKEKFGYSLTTHSYDTFTALVYFEETKQDKTQITSS